MAGLPVRKTPPEEWRDYQIVKLTGWTEEQILDQRSHWLDWLLEIDKLVKDADDADGER